MLAVLRRAGALVLFTIACLAPPGCGRTALDQPCVSDTDCPVGETCDPGTKTCTVPGGGNPDGGGGIDGGMSGCGTCPANTVCVNDRCEPVTGGCTDGFCPPGSVCIDGNCVAQTCDKGGAPCPPGSTCENGGCVSPCPPCPAVAV